MRWRVREDFLAPYKEKSPPWGPLGWVTYHRTYARLKEDGTKEEWWETVRRVVEGNVNLAPDDPTLTQEELHELYDTLFHLAWTPAGRGLWMSGTPLSFEVGDALVNCWMTVAGLYHGRVSFPFHFLFDEAMKGGGVGVNVSRTHLATFPPVRNLLELHLTLDPNHPNYLEALPWLTHDTPRGRFYPVEDSREGWGKALSLVIDSHFDGTTALHLDFSRVRPRGQPIRRFGGVASGPAPLIELLHHIHTLLNRRAGQRLRSVDVLDMVNLVGRAVVAGNVRRTAILVLGDLDDPDFRSAKDFSRVDPILEKGPSGAVIWEQGPSGTWYRKQKPLAATGLSPERYQELSYAAWAQDNHRWSSNNSVIVDGALRADAAEEIAQHIAVNGEPGVVNLELIRNTGRLVDGWQPGIDGRVVGVNPCGEVNLEDGEPCNLVEIFPYLAIRQGYDLRRVLYLAARYAKRVTMAPYEWPHSREVVARNRRLGVSLSGIQDWLLLVGREGIERQLQEMYEVVRATDEAYAKALGVPRSIKLTTVKPSGTVALLPGVSPGIHWHYFRYGIRRVRLREDDPLAELLRQAGYPVVPALQEPHSVVVEFPMRALTADLPGFRPAGEVSLEEQLANQALLQERWADNSVSATLTFHPHEVPQIAGLLCRYVGKLKATSLLPYTGHGYAQAPYEPTSEEEYRRRAGQLRERPDVLYRKLRRQDANTDPIADLADCNGGSCPAR